MVTSVHMVADVESDKDGQIWVHHGCTDSLLREILF